MAKHTPGPWRIVGDDEGCKSIEAYGEDEHGIFSVSEIGFTDGIEEGEDKANARLIAAAPDMLNALKYIKRCKLYGPADQAWELIDAAIAKADGE